MKRIALLTLTILACALHAFADPISEAEAQQLAAKFLSHEGSASSKRRAAGSHALTLARQSEGYYLFNCGSSGGYVVVANNDLVGDPILAYADDGTVDPDNMPDNMRAWLEGYDSQMVFLQSHPQRQDSSLATAEATRPAVAPLVESLWSQESPYNSLCPKSGRQSCYVGCTAVALAQVMRHHQWPERGQGSYSYDWRVGGTLTAVAADFSADTYRWDLMENRYAVSATGEAADAVALLCYDVGVASHMQYSTSGSGAYLYDAGHGLLTYFDYDKSLRLVNRDYYGHDEWQDLIYGELASGRPVVYSGYTGSMYGHTFVVDGYQDGYYHFNWGWAGQYNGYFRLSALYPYGYGTNGQSFQYNYRQEALVGIQPNAGTLYATPELQCGGISTAAASASFTDEVSFSCTLSYVGLYERSLQLGIAAVSTATGDTVYLLQDATTLDVNDRRSLGKVAMTSFPHAAGTYEILPIAYDPAASQYYKVRMRSGSAQGGGPGMGSSGSSYVVATVRGDSIFFSTPGPAASAQLSFSDLTLPATLRAGMDFLATATVSATGADYYGDVALAFYPEGDNASAAASTRSAVADVADGGTCPVSLVGSTPSPGTYVVRMTDGRGNAFGPDTTVVVGDSITTRLTLRAAGLTMPSTIEVDPADIEMEFNVSCTGGSYCNNFFVHFYEQGGSSEYLSLNTDLVSLAEGDDLTLRIAGSVDGLKPATTYTAYVLYNASGWAYVLPYTQSQVTFTTAAASAVQAIETDNQPADLSVYTLSGTLVSRQHASMPSLEGLPRGIYVVKTANGSRKVAKW